MRTTIDISDAVLRELRGLAHATRRPFRVVVEDTLQRGLGGAARRSRRARVRIETGPVGVQETDALIAAHAVEQGAVVHTSDLDFSRFRGLRWKRPLEPGE